MQVTLFAGGGEAVATYTPQGIVWYCQVIGISFDSLEIFRDALAWSRSCNFAGECNLHFWRIPPNVTTKWSWKNMKKSEGLSFFFCGSKDIAKYFLDFNGNHHIPQHMLLYNVTLFFGNFILDSILQCLQKCKLHFCWLPVHLCRPPYESRGAYKNASYIFGGQELHDFRKCARAFWGPPKRKIGSDTTVTECR